MPNKPLSLCTGEELHHAFGGHGSPRKSKQTNGIQTGNADPILWLKRVTLKKSLKLATTNKRKLTLAKARNRRFERSEFRPCVRRWLEFASNGRFENLKKFGYTAKPTLIRSPDRFIYELSVALVPICCFTDGGEAFETCQAFLANGLASAEINQIDLTEQVKETTLCMFKEASL